MLAAVFRGPGDLDVTEIETPEAGPGEVVVRVGANTVCGTDVRILRGEKTRGVEPPVVLGHELAGHIAEVGRGVEGYEVGAPVAMYPLLQCGRCFYCLRGMENVCEHLRIFGNVENGGLAEYVRLPARAVERGNLFVAREERPIEELALAEPLACCVNGLEKYRVEVGDTVVILGAGPIGLLHLQLALLSGAREVIVSNPSEPRRRFAERLGATVTVDPRAEDLPEVVRERTGGRGADAAVICIGKPELVNEALRLVRKGGRVNAFAGLSGAGWAEVEANLIHYNEVLLSGGSNCRRRDFETAMRLIEERRIDTAAMVTDRFPLAEAARAIERSSRSDGMKVAVMP
ncbi:Threonine dehydrogenase and related Zn-dependent dehydrogenase (plasmid) [Rubrobacter radiotolerans]|uniref:Alcohol dehydrogenase catalytic domain-containing protein n=1 Tax=Rubrobacter radiotolerans TaxID=42256 RepID=A0A023X8D8_RUBRA|nr:alcohol dehydrogenase catalytic domain-containing protein [Rubrobacter radiotolerans]AHY48310.1 Threonine dehydrogenase and related Zn-dependent dehydrogenase [Rubrobacter radiotolerans]MDX5895583.1 alcohol dehydrogenase catalytic domain-containing protein [Rubrobacter radiotolerans]SMC01507.1 L-iditol 2-dehydrogenase [Rubrobacter radiotolerans DSM 5868]